MVTFYVFDTPVRFIRFVSVLKAPPEHGTSP